MRLSLFLRSDDNLQVVLHGHTIGGLAARLKQVINACREENLSRPRWGKLIVAEGNFKDREPLPDELLDLVSEAR